MTKLDHLGVAVPSLAAGLALYRDLLGLEVLFEEEVSTEQVRVAGLAVGGGACIELLEPTSAESVIARHLERRGPGLHHVALAVDDLDATLARLRKAGVKLLDETPRPGAQGCRVAFIHPKGPTGPKGSNGPHDVPGTPGGPGDATAAAGGATGGLGVLLELVERPQRAPTGH